jgi:hypothetical protein
LLPLARTLELIYHADPGSRTAQALGLLATLAENRLAEQRAH